MQVLYYNAATGKIKENFVLSLQHDKTQNLKGVIIDDPIEVITDIANCVLWDEEGFFTGENFVACLRIDTVTKNRRVKSRYDTEQGRLDAKHFKSRPKLTLEMLPRHYAEFYYKPEIL